MTSAEFVELAFSAGMVVGANHHRLRHRDRRHDFEAMMGMFLYGEP